MISYYELLGMIKEDKAPKEIRVHLTPETSKLYVRESDIDDTFNCYVIDEDEETSEDYKYYLTDCYIESMMFEKTVEILDEKGVPEKLDIKIQNETTGNAYITNEQGTKCYLTKHSKIIAERLNQVIDYLKSKGDE